MPTIFSHAIVASGIHALAPGKGATKKCLLFAIGCSILPDADVAGFAMGIEYGDFWGHRGFSHSILFSILIGLSVAALFFREYAIGSRAWWIVVSILTASGVSHGVLDGLTNGGLGIAYLAPFDTTRYFLPWSPIPVSPIGAGFFSSRGIFVICAELLLVGLPAGIVIFCRRMARRRKSNAKDNQDGSVG